MAADRRGARLRAKLTSLGNAHARDAGWFDGLAARVRRPLDRRFLRRFGLVDELELLGRSCADASAEPPRATTGQAPRVLVVALRAFPNHTAHELVIAQALRLRGAEVALLTCGSGLPVCEMGWARRTWPRPCDRCAHFTDELIEGAGLPAYRLRDTLPWGPDGRRAPESAAEVDAGIDAEAAAAISSAWFLHSAEVAAVPEGRAAVRDFEVTAAGVARAAEKVLDDFNPDVVFMVNGLFAPERVIRELALRRGIRAPTYEMTPRANTIFLSQDSPAPHYDIDHIWERVRGRPLTEEQREAGERLLVEREKGVGAYERFFEEQEESPDALRRLLDIPEDQRVVSLYTNLPWDSATLEREVGFPSMVDWVGDAIRAVRGLSDTVLVIRVHPADEKWGSRQDVRAAAIARAGGLPPNVRFVAPDEPLSSYALLGLSERVLVYASTAGLEAACRGLPVAVGAKVHYRGRGFTWEVDGPDDLRRFLEDADARMDAARMELARRYLFAFFFRALIPFPSVRLAGARPLAVPTSAQALTPGADPYLDLICDKLVTGEDFELPDELARLGSLDPADEDARAPVV